MLETFGEEYSGLKAPRKLQWKSFLGSVVLVITAGGHQREMRVSMLHVRPEPFAHTCAAASLRWSQHLWL